MSRIYLTLGVHHLYVLFLTAPFQSGSVILVCEFVLAIFHRLFGFVPATAVFVVLLNQEAFSLNQIFESSIL